MNYKQILFRKRYIIDATRLWGWDIGSDPSVVDELSFKLLINYNSLALCV